MNRKDYPLYSGLMAYFPDALMAVANLSLVASKQHGHAVMHWDRAKSTDHPDCIMRHLLQKGHLDDDGVSHTVKVAWRSLALLQEEIEATLSVKSDTFAAHDQWRDLEMDADAPRVPMGSTRLAACPYACHDEEQRRRARAEHSGTEPC